MIPHIYGENKVVKKIVCNHEGYDELEDELKIIVDMGGKIIDVIVEHPLYGEIKSPLEISSRLEVQQFMKNLKQTNAEPLSSLTAGIHIHTIEVDSEENLDRIKEALDGKKYLINVMGLMIDKEQIKTNGHLLDTKIDILVKYQNTI